MAVAKLGGQNMTRTGFDMERFPLWDAVKVETDNPQWFLLRWDFYDTRLQTSPHTLDVDLNFREALRSVLMPVDAVDQILAWRDAELKKREAKA